MAAMICVSCPVGCELSVTEAGGAVSVAGNACKRGEAYGRQEFTAPMRMVTSTVKVVGGARPVVPVKTSRPVPKGRVRDVLRVIDGLRPAAPVSVGDILAADVLGLGADVVATDGT